MKGSEKKGKETKRWGRGQASAFGESRRRERQRQAEGRRRWLCHAGCLFRREEHFREEGEACSRGPVLLPLKIALPSGPGNPGDSG